MGSYNLKDNYSQAGHRPAVHNVVVAVLLVEVHIHVVVGVGHRTVVEHSCSRHVEDMWWVPIVEVDYSRPTMKVAPLGSSEVEVEVEMQLRMTSTRGQPPPP